MPTLASEGQRLCGIWFCKEKISNILFRKSAARQNVLHSTIFSYEASNCTNEITKYEYHTCPNVNRFIVKDYFVRPKELLMG
jgi:hypothetical protein